jgi:phosphoribosyl-AMP cyclohydrolase
MQSLDELKYTSDGLIPAIIQNVEDGAVLMMAWMNRTALEQTIQTGKTHFWSRSRQKYWMKGETSGHVQEVESVHIDCDMDCLLIRVRQHGAACHEGYRSCFFRKNDEDQWIVTDERMFDPEAVYGKK